MFLGLCPVPTLIALAVFLVVLGITRVVSAAEMRDAVLAVLPDQDVLIMAAAVADFRPATRAAGKPRRADGGPDTLAIEPTPDVLATAKAAAPPGLHIVGFALEAGNLTAGARRKLESKGVDLIVADGPSAIGASITTVAGSI